MALTKDGLTTKRFTDFFEDLNAGIKALQGSNVDTAENSLLGHLHSNMALRFAELAESIQAVYDSGDLRVAEGAALDNLALHAGVKREGAKQTQGKEYFEGLNGVVIPAGARMSSAKGDEFITKLPFTITTERCLQARIYVGTVIDSIDYTLIVEGSGILFNSGTSSTQDIILTGLKGILDTAGYTTNTLVLDSDMSKSYLLMDKIDKSTALNITGISYLKFDNVVTSSDIYSKEYGEISGDAGAIEEILTSVTNWYSVTNPASLKLGTGIETDNQLRLRTITEFNTAGSGNYDSIVSSVLRLDGVKNCIVKENTTNATVDGIPPVSYEVVVNGGVDADIARVVWETRPACIYTHGSQAETIVDFNGYDKTVRFSPATPRYATIRVQYTPYTEEDLPSGAIDAAKAAMLKFANDTLTMDDDIIAKRFLGAIYNASTGFGDIAIDVAVKPNAGDTVIAGDYKDVEAITDKQVGQFSVDRINFSVK